MITLTISPCMPKSKNMVYANAAQQCGEMNTYLHIVNFCMIKKTIKLILTNNG